MVLGLASAVQAEEKASNSFAPAAKSINETPNETYLNNTRLGLDTEAQETKDAQSFIYGDKLSGRMSQEYLDLNRDYEMKQRYGLMGQGLQSEQNGKKL